MIDDDRAKEIIKEVSDKSNILDKYFEYVGENVLCGTDLLHNRFLWVVISSLNVETTKPAKVTSYSLNYRGLWRLFSKLENEIKEDLLSRFSPLVVNVMAEAESIKKTEIDRLCAEKEGQIETLEKQLKTLQEKADSFEKQIEFLEVDNKTMKGFFIDKEEWTNIFS